LLVPTKEGADLGPCRQVVPKLHADHLIDKHESSTIGDPLVPKVVNIVVPKQRAENTTGVGRTTSDDSSPGRRHDHTTVTDLAWAQVRRQTILNGLIGEYSQVA
jgi:hypothetical protein